MADTTTTATAATDAAQPQDWSKPAAMALPKEGYFEHQQGRYGPVFPKTPANYGFTVIGKVLPGREGAVRDYGKTIEAAVNSVKVASKSCGGSDAFSAICRSANCDPKSRRQALRGGLRPGPGQGGGSGLTKGQV